MRKVLTLILSSLLAVSLVLTGCNTESGEASSSSNVSSGSNIQTAAADSTGDTTQIDNFDFTLTDRDQDASYDETASTTIVFNTAHQVETITEEGTYIISGSSEGGQLIVDLTNAEDAENAKAQIVLDDLTLTNSTAPALLITQADKVFITLAEGSNNTLSDGSGRTDIEALGTDTVGAESETTEEAEGSNENATLYSHDDLSINGTGSLTVTSANHHAIKCQDDLVIASGTISVTAAGDGIRGKDSVKIAGGTIQVETGDDGIVSTQTDYPTEKGFVSITGGEITVNVADDGVKGEALVRLAGGSVNVQSCTEGLEACLIWIEGGIHSITSSDDAVNAAGDIRTDYLLNITGGMLFVDAEGDGIDSNNAITQSGGTVVVAGPTIQGNGAIDAEFSASATGGTMIGVDSSGMSMGYGTESTQGSLLYMLPSVQQANTRISLVDSSSTVLFTFVAPKQFNALVYSSPLLTVGESYSFVIGGDVSGASLTADQASATQDETSGSFGFEFLEGGTISGGETLTSFTLTEQVAQISSDGTVSAYSGQGMMGGGPGGGGQMGGQMGGGPGGGGQMGGGMAGDPNAGQAPPGGTQQGW